MSRPDGEPEFDEVSRPTSFVPRGGKRKTAFAVALRTTLASGNAIQVHLNDEPIRDLQSRKSAYVSTIAKQLKCRGHVLLAEDRLSVYCWLEPKP